MLSIDNARDWVAESSSHFHCYWWSVFWVLRHVTKNTPYSGIWVRPWVVAAGGVSKHCCGFYTWRPHLHCALPLTSAVIFWRLPLSHWNCGACFHRQMKLPGSVQSTEHAQASSWLAIKSQLSTLKTGQIFSLNLLGWHWLVKLCSFQVYNSMIHHLYMALWVHYPRSTSPCAPCSYVVRYDLCSRAVPSSSDGVKCGMGLWLNWHSCSEFSLPCSPHCLRSLILKPCHNASLAHEFSFWGQNLVSPA